MLARRLERSSERASPTGDLERVLEGRTNMFYGSEETAGQDRLGNLSRRGHMGPSRDYAGPIGGGPMD
jgi:hypothetical protein